MPDKVNIDDELLELDSQEERRCKIQGLLEYYTSPTEGSSGAADQAARHA